VRAGWSQCCNGREDEEEARYGKSTNQSRASFVLKSLSSILTDSDPDDGRDDSLTDIQPFFDEQGEESELWFLCLPVRIAIEIEPCNE
jgi:hypothetical protein